MSVLNYLKTKLFNVLISIGMLISDHEFKDEPFIIDQKYADAWNKSIEEHGYKGDIIPAPKDKCPYNIDPNIYCCRPLLEGYNFCFWHVRTTDKYKSEIITQYFGTDQTLIKAIENEVIQRRSLKRAFLREAGLGGNWYKKGVNLSKADLREADLNGAFLSYGSLKGANLNFANLESTFLSDVDIRDVHFYNTNLHNAKFRNNVFDGVKGLTKECFRGWKWRIIPEYKILEDYPEYSVGIYRSLTTYFIRNTSLSDASWAAYKERVEHRKLLRKNLSLNKGAIEIIAEQFTGHRKFNRYQKIALFLCRFSYRFISLIISYLSCFICGYGEKPLRVIITGTFAIFSYAFIYKSLGALSESGLKTAIYFSTVTFTTLGYGDVIPKPEFRMFAASEALAGIILTGLFLFALSRRAFGRG